MVIIYLYGENSLGMAEYGLTCHKSIVMYRSSAGILAPHVAT